MNFRRKAICLTPLLISTLLPLGVCAESVTQVHSVYLLPMAKGMDQYLASSLTRHNVVNVVADPKSADAVFTDNLGAGFQDRLFQLRPELKPAAPAKHDNPDRDAQNPDEAYVPPPSTFHSSKGTIFLVDVHTQHVIWSTFEPDGGFKPKDISKVADRIAKQLWKDRQPPKPKKGEEAAVVPAAAASAPTTPAPAPAPATTTAPAPAPAKK